MSNVEKSENLITTYKERSLHAALKRYFCPDEDLHELKIGKFVADACDGTVIYEIQTGNLSRLAKKLDFYLQNTEYEVVIVHPLAQNRRILWLDEETGELARAPRLSPKHESLFDGISDLYYLKDYLGNPKISFCFPIMEIDEIRFCDGYGKHNKIRATSLDRLAGEIYSIEYVNCAEDIRDAIYSVLPDGEFRRTELSRSLKLNELKLWSAQKLLLELGILSCRKEGKKLMLQKNQQK